MTDAQLGFILEELARIGRRLEDANEHLAAIRQAVEPTSASPRPPRRSASPGRDGQEHGPDEDELL